MKATHTATVPANPERFELSLTPDDLHDPAAVEGWLFRIATTSSSTTSGERDGRELALERLLGELRGLVR